VSSSEAGVSGFNEAPGHPGANGFNEAPGHPGANGFNEAPGHPGASGFNEAPGRPRGSEACIDLVQRLSDLPGVGGDEGAVRDAIWAHIADHVAAARIDALGSLIARRGTGGPRVLIDAHMDEVGLLVRSVDKDGWLRFVNVGGIDPRVLPGAVVRVGAEAVPGVIAWRAIHLQSEDDRKRVVPIKDLAIDIGAASREQAERAVKPGDYAVFATRAGFFGDGLLRGKADRVGCAILAETLAAPADYGLEVHGVFAVQEEIGLRGAGPAAYAVAPDVAIALEGTTCADLPGVEEHEQGTRLGGGPVLRIMDGGMIHDRRVNAVLAAAAEAAGIPYQWKGTTTGGTDAGRIHTVRGGIPSATLSVPCRYIHGPCAVASRADIGNALALLQAFLRMLATRGLPA
jgi:putative aminopeptidase FrvX